MKRDTRQSLAWILLRNIWTWNPIVLWLSRFCYRLIITNGNREILFCQTSRKQGSTVTHLISWISETIPFSAPGYVRYPASPTQLHRHWSQSCCPGQIDKLFLSTVHQKTSDWILSLLFFFLQQAGKPVYLAKTLRMPDTVDNLSKAWMQAIRTPLVGTSRAQGSSSSPFPR